MKSDHYSLYKADAMRQLRSGCLAIQVMAAEDYLSVPAAKPGIMPPTDRIEGLSLGGRILSQLALAI
ncbi:predicted protein, partial [Haematococcus lacustris]